MSSTASSAQEIRSQWQNPSDIFSLLLLVGGDIVQKAIAFSVGPRLRLLWIGPNVLFTPVAFSFGWVAYAFMSLASVFGDHRLMPAPDTEIQVINCDNGYVRTNNSWLLGRLLRDKEGRVDELGRSKNPPAQSTGQVSLAIDIFVAKSGHPDGPPKTLRWWLCCLVILVQHVVSIIPWIIDQDWSIFVITVGGTALAIVTAGLPQWAAEKWSASRHRSDKIKVLALTRGNGYRYVMVILCHEGAWDLEALASGRPHVIPATRFVLLLFVLLWVVLLITVTGLKEHSWFLVAVGGVGMIQNVVLAAIPSKPRDFDIDMEPWAPRPTITGYQFERDRKKELKDQWKRWTINDAIQEYDTSVTEGDVRDVMGTLIELEKNQKGAGAALIPIFFPGTLDYKSSGLGNQRERLFWEHAGTK